MRINFLKRCFSRQFVLYGSFGLCMVYFCSCGKQKPTNLADSYFKLAFTELSEGDDREGTYRRALGFIQKAIDCSPKAEYYALQGSLLFKLNDIEKSKQAYEQALKSAPTGSTIKAEIFNNYACLLAQQGDMAQAKKYLHQLIGDTAYQTPEVAWVNMGKVLAGEKDFNGAMDCFSKAAHLEPNYLDAHWNLALVARELGQNKKAKLALDTILTLEPTHAGAARLLAQVG